MKLTIIDRNETRIVNVLELRLNYMDWASVSGPM